VEPRSAGSCTPSRGTRRWRRRLSATSCTTSDTAAGSATFVPEPATGGSVSVVAGLSCS
jgi:hypothetical protein